MSDNPILTSWVRTVVPALWATLVAWLVSKVPFVADFADELNGLVEPLLVPLVLAAVYAFLRKVEPYLPDWLTRVFLGSPKIPAYRPAAH